jgi:hypothetical protein
MLTSHQHQSSSLSAQLEAIGSATDNAVAGRFSDALISLQTLVTETVPEIKVSSSDVMLPTQRRIPNFPVPRMDERRRNFQEKASWEGVVIQVKEEGVIAKLSRRYQDFPAEEALIPWGEITPADQSIAKDGATFSWKVGYLEESGQRMTVSKIEFRRIPNFSAREQAAATAKAAEYAALFHD